MPWVPGLLVRILTSERARTGELRVVDALFDVVQHKKLAGITVSHALEGARASEGMHTARVQGGSDGALVIVEIVDRTERIEPLLPRFASLVASGLLTVIDVRLYFPAPSLTVGDILQKPRIVVQPEAALSEVLGALLDDGIRLLPVVGQQGTLVGVVTLGHLLHAADPALGAHLLEDRGTPEHVRTHLDRLIHGRTVRDVMIAPPHVLHPELTLAEAVRNMTNAHITRAPVVDGERRLVGLISERMLIAALIAPVARSLHPDVDVLRPEDAELSGMLRRSVHPAAGEPLTAGLLADGEVPIVVESAPWDEVVDAFMGSVSCLVLVVTPERRLSGVIDEQAVLGHAIPGTTSGLGRVLHRTLWRAPGQMFAALLRHPARPIDAAHLLHTPPLTVLEDTPVADALARMVQAEHGEWAVVVTAEKRPLGILRRNEALHALVSD